MSAPSPNLQRRMNNTANIVSKKHLLHDLYSKYPEDYLDINTYNSLVANKPWISSSEKTGLTKSLQSQVVAGGDKILVICVDFSDKPASVPISTINNRFFGTNDNTLRSYYTEVSNGMYVPDGIVIGWYRAPQTYAYYRDSSGCNYGGGTYPNNSQRLFEDTLDIINRDSSVTNTTFSELDVDGDGHLNRVIIVHAGGEASVGGDCGEIWAREWGIPQKTVKGKIFNFFATVSEYIDTPADVQRCGIDCHEFGHILGLPDLYIATGQSIVGFWSLMDHGDWGTDQAITPTHLDVWCKNMLGWIVVHTNEVGTISIGDIENYHIAYMYTTSNPGEYFMIENRQQVGFDQHLPGNGLLIWHINERESQSNISCHKVSLMQADNKRDLENNINFGDADDPYPGGANNRSFNSISGPNSLLCDGSESYFEISNISDSGTTISMTISNTAITDNTRGNVRILSTPSGARIWIDSADRNVYTPAEIKNIPLWPHTYTLKLAGYRDFTGNFTLVGGETTEIFATLIMSTPNTGSASFTSVPFRTKIWMDSVDTGLYTPNTIQELVNGNHTFRLVIVGYQDAVGTFTSSSGDTTIIPTMRLVRNASNTGNVYITSAPPGATIQIVGISQSGYTPKLMTDIPFGNYTYTLTLNDYQDARGTFSIFPGRATEEMSTMLTQNSENASFTSIPSGARIWIDNVDTGLNTPNTIPATLTSHTFRLVLTGYKDASGTFSLSSGFNTIIPTVNLVEIGASHNLLDMLSPLALPIGIILGMDWLIKRINKKNITNLKF